MSPKKKKELKGFWHARGIHDSVRILSLRQHYGFEGLGIYWCIIEELHQMKYIYMNDLGYILFRIRCDEKSLLKILNTELFEHDDEKYWCKETIENIRYFEKTGRTRKPSEMTDEPKYGGQGNRNYEAERIRAERMCDARKKGRHTKQEWIAMVSFFKDTCCRCKGHSGDPNIVKDHILPVYLGGSDSIKNIQPLCVHCNSAKGPEDIDWRPSLAKILNKEIPTEWLP